MAEDDTSEIMPVFDAHRPNQNMSDQMLVKYDRNGCVWRLFELLVKCISTLEHELFDCHSIIQRIVDFI